MPLVPKQRLLPALPPSPRRSANMPGTVRVLARFAPLLILAGFLAVCAAAPSPAPAATNRQDQPPAPETPSSRKAYRAVADPAFAGGENAGFAETKNAARGESLPNAFLTAAGPVRGTGALGHSPPPRPDTPPRPGYGGTPGDYARGYEGMNPTPGDFWHRESDFRARNYTTRHSPPPAYAAPSRPPVGGKGERVIEPYDPILPRPPLPGDSDPPARVLPVAPGAAP